MLASVVRGRPTEPEARRIADWWKKQSTGFEATWAELAAAAGLDWKELNNGGGLRLLRFKGPVCRAAKRLLLAECGVFPLTVPGTGWRNPTGIEQVRHATKELRSGARKIKKATKIAGVITDERLTAQERNVRALLCDKLVRLEEFARSEVRSAALIVGKTPALPRP